MTFCSVLIGASCYDAAKDFATPVIALSVGLIAFFQWRTAQRKIALDLLDRRVTAFNEMYAVVAAVVREGQVVAGSIRTFNDAEFKVRCLFGPELTEPLDGLRTALGVIYSMRNAKTPVADEIEDRRQAAFLSLEGYLLELEPRVLPYVAFTDKVPKRRAWDRLVE